MPHCPSLANTPPWCGATGRSLVAAPPGRKTVRTRPCSRAGPGARPPRRSPQIPSTSAGWGRGSPWRRTTKPFGHISRDIEREGHRVGQGLDLGVMDPLVRIGHARKAAGAYLHAAKTQHGKGGSDHTVSRGRVHAWRSSHRVSRPRAPRRSVALAYRHQVPGGIGHSGEEGGIQVPARLRAALATACRYR